MPLARADDHLDPHARATSARAAQAERASRAAILAGACVAVATSGCQGSLLFAGVSFAPWMGCALVGTLVAYAIARVLEARLFAYDPRYFVWTFLALATLCSIVLWNLVARPPPG